MIYFCIKLPILKGKKLTFDLLPKNDMYAKTQFHIHNIIYMYAKNNFLYIGYFLCKEIAKKFANPVAIIILIPKT